MYNRRSLSTTNPEALARAHDVLAAAGIACEPALYTDRTLPARAYQVSPGLNLSAVLRAHVERTGRKPEYHACVGPNMLLLESL